ncbi:MAG: polyamine aminopropyltransferase [Chitinophagales bacterium]
MLKEASSKERLVFFLTVFIAGLCSLIYELLISTTSSYFLGDSVTQFSLTIGVYMAAMGLGAYLSQFLDDKLLDWFVKIEVLLGLAGGVSVPVLYFVFGQVSTFEYQFIMLSLTAVIGVLTGFEVPLLVRILKTYYPLKSNLAYVLSLDYIGALLATLLFPFLLLPFVGIFRTSLLFGLVNVLLGLFIYRFFTQELSVKRKMGLQLAAFAVVVLFVVMGIFAGKLLKHWEDDFYTSQLIYSKQTAYQHLVLTKNKEDLQLYINHIIQFSSLDEYRYHEALGLLPLNVAPNKKKVLILGGGEGLLAREVLKFEEVESVKIVDLDGEVFKLAKENNYIRTLNQGSISNAKVEPITEDAMQFLQFTDEKFDVILSDLPDPSNESLSRLYSTIFYKLIQSKLSENGIFATQATGPFHTHKAFWCIYETLKASGFKYVYPYHAYVPSFGDWGFVIASDIELQPDVFEAKISSKYLDSLQVQKMFYFEKDIANPHNLAVNRMDDAVLMHYFLEDWRKWQKKEH